MMKKKDDKGRIQRKRINMKEGRGEKCKGRNKITSVKQRLGGKTKSI